MKSINKDREDNNYRSIIEALLFVSEKPLLVDQIRHVLGELEPSAIRSMLEELKSEYLNSNRGIRIIEIAGGFQMVTNPGLSAPIKKFYQKPAERLSRPTLETLAIIAYKQPVTRIEIESFRGVDTSGIVKNLISKGIVRIVGRKKSPGLFNIKKGITGFIGGLTG